MNIQNNSDDDWGFYIDIETAVSPDLITITDEIHHSRHEKYDDYYTNTYYDEYSNDMYDNDSTSNLLNVFIVRPSLTIITTAYHILSFLNIID